MQVAGAVGGGASHRYRFEVHHPGGSGLVVENWWEPSTYHQGEIDWWRQLRLLVMAPGASWDGAEMPVQKPAFDTIVPDVAGGFWLIRQGPSTRVPDCDEDPRALGVEFLLQVGSEHIRRCWQPLWLIDAFDAEGQFRGRVESLKFMEQIQGDGLHPRMQNLFVDGDTVIAAVEGEDGIARVKRYRLVPPE